MPDTNTQSPSYDLWSDGAAPVNASQTDPSFDLGSDLSTPTAPPKPYDFWRDTPKLFVDEFKVSSHDVYRDYHDLGYMLNPFAQHEEEMAAMQNVDSKDYQTLAGEMQQLHDSAPWPVRIAADAENMVPSLGVAFGAGFAGGTINTAAGGPLTAALAAVPVVGEILAPAKAGIDFTIGDAAGSYTAFMSMNTGRMYGDLRRLGISKPGATAAATAYGSLSAAFYQFGLGAFKSLGGKAMSQSTREVMDSALNSEYAQRLQKNAWTRLGAGILQSVGSNTVAAGADSLTSQITVATEQIIEHSDPSGFSDPKKMADTVGQTMLQALTTSALVSAGIATVGHGAGKVAGEAKTQLPPEVVAHLEESFKGKNPAEIMKAVNEGLRHMPRPWEKPEETSLQYHTDENGKLSVVAGAEKTQDVPLADATQGGPTAEQVAAHEGPQNVMSDQEAKAVAKSSGLPVEEVHKTANALANDAQAAVDAIYPQDAALAPLTDKKGRVVEANNDFTLMSEPEIQARTNQISSDVRNLLNEQDSLIKQINLKSKLGHSTDQLNRKLEAVITARQGLEHERALVDSGLLSREEMGTSSGKQRMTVIAKQMDLIKKGAKQEQRSIKSKQADMLRLINAATKDPEIRTKLAAKVAKATTDAQLSKAATGIQGELQTLETQKAVTVDAAQRDKIVGQIEKLINQGKVKTISGHPVNVKLDADTVATLQKIKGYIKEPGTAEAVVADFEAKYGKEFNDRNLENIPTDDLVNFQIAAHATGLKGKNQMELNITKGVLAQMVADGRAIVEQKKADARARRESFIATANASTGADVHERVQGQTKSDKSKLNRSAAVNEVRTWDGLLNKLSAKDPEHKITDLLNPLPSRTAAKTATNVIHAYLETRLQAALTEAGHDINIVDKGFEDGNTQFRIKSPNIDGKMKTMVHSRAELIDISMKMLDSTLHDAMRDTEEGNGWTLAGDVKPGKSTEEIVHSLLRPEDIAVRDELLGFYRDYHNRVNETYRDIFGVDLPQRDSYSPVSRKGYKVDPGDGVSFSSVLPGSSRTRTNSLLYVEPRNAYQVAIEHTQQWERFIHQGQFIQDVRAVQTDPKFRTHVADTQGSGTLNVIDHYIGSFIHDNPWFDSKSHPFWAALSHDMTPVALGLRYGPQALYHVAAGPAMWAEHTPFEVLKGAAQAVLHPKKLEDALRSSDYMRLRFTEGAGPDMQEMLRDSGMGSKVFEMITGIENPQLNPHETATMNAWLFNGFRYGDAGKARFFGGPLYFAELGRGATPEEALAKVENAFETTQIGKGSSQVPYMIAKSREFAAVFGKFTQQPNQLLNLSAKIVSDFANAPKKSIKPFMNLGWGLATAFFLPNFLMGVIKNASSTLPGGTQSPEKDQKRNATLAVDTLVENFHGIPLFGQVAEAAWFTLAKPLIGTDLSKETAFYGLNPIYQMFYENPKSAAQYWAKLSNPSTTAPKDFDPLAPVGNKPTTEKAIGKTVRALAPVFATPQATFNIPTGVVSALEHNDPLGAGAALLGLTTQSSLEERYKAPKATVGDFDPMAKQPEGGAVQKIIEALKNGVLQNLKQTPDIHQTMIDAQAQHVEDEMFAPPPAPALPNEDKYDKLMTEVDQLHSAVQHRLSTGKEAKRK